MSFGKFLDPKNDFAFKQIFGREKNKDILIPFLNEMLSLKDADTIKDLQFLNPSLDPDAAAKKQSVVDVLCQDQENRQYIVEMQVAKTKGFEKRAQYYAAKTYSKQLFQGERYEDLKEVIFLAITDFVMFEDSPAYKSEHVILNKETHHHELRDLAFTFLELPKFKKPLDELKTLTDRWLYFFKHAEQTSEQDVERVVGGQRELAKAYEELNRFSWTDNEILLYEREEKSERDLRAMIDAGIDKGRAEGRAEGGAKKQQEIALRMLHKGWEEMEIAETTGLSLVEIQALRSRPL